MTNKNLLIFAGFVFGAGWIFMALAIVYGIAAGLAEDVLRCDGSLSGWRGSPPGDNSPPLSCVSRNVCASHPRAALCCAGLRLSRSENLKAC
jgi:hypothetical protein